MGVSDAKKTGDISVPERQKAVCRSVPPAAKYGWEKHMWESSGAGLKF